MRKLSLLITLLFAGELNAQTLLGGMPQPSGDVYAIERVGNTVYVGGTFFQVNGVPDTGLFSFDALTGVVNWMPSATGVDCIRHIGDQLIVGGSFLNVNSQQRYGICVFDRTTGALESWRDTANILSWRQGIGVDSIYFYFGKTTSPFSSACRIRSVDVTTGLYTGWMSDSIVHGDVQAILVEGNYVYVGGHFNIGTMNQFDNLCRFSKTTGALDTSWHPRPQINNFGVQGIVKLNAGIFVGGDFDTIAGVHRKGVAAFDTIGNLTPFSQNSSSWEVLSIYGAGDHIWVGGNSFQLGGATRYRIAEINAYTGVATCWNASATSSSWSTVQALFVSGDTVYAGPFGLPHLSVFTGSPRPQTAGGSIAGPDTVTISQVATYNVPPFPGYQYNWIVNGGTGASTTDSITITWGNGPSGSLSVIETNPSFSNCSGDTVTLQVIIQAVSGLREPGQGRYSVLPNPARNFIKISAKESHHDVYVSVFDITGKTILTGHQLAREEGTIDVSELPAGVYFIRLLADEFVQVVKMVKE